MLEIQRSPLAPRRKYNHTLKLTDYSDQHVLYEDQTVCVALKSLSLTLTTDQDPQLRGVLICTINTSFLCTHLAAMHTVATNE